ncbi:MAG: bacillithiol biosynthesis deacetylase BshB1 [Cytophagaceae bacterium]
MKKVDILVIAAHPDDAELACSGTIAKQVQAGYTVAILDLTAGELGTRGTPELREEEAKESTRILGVKYRWNAGLRDGFFEITEEQLLEVIKYIRLAKPDIIIANAPEDRHPDHGRAASLVERASFLSGLRKIETKWEEEAQEPWRPKNVYHYIQDRWLKPDFIVDISSTFSIKVNAIKAFKSQFYDPNNSEPETYISSSTFMQYIEGRAIEFGHQIGVQYGEGFISAKSVGVDDISTLI